MKVGDLVRQNPDNNLIQIKGGLSSKNIGKRMLGTIVAIHDGVWPKDWDLSDYQKQWEMNIGRRVDVLWSSGLLTKNFAENILEVVASSADKENR